MVYRLGLIVRKYDFSHIINLGLSKRNLALCLFFFEKSILYSVVWVVRERVRERMWLFFNLLLNFSEAFLAQKNWENKMIEREKKVFFKSPIRPISGYNVRLHFKCILT